MPSKSVAKFLSAQNSGLHTLLEHAHQLREFTLALQKILQEILPNPELSEHVRFANLRDDTAVITTDTPAWLTQLRYQAPTILKRLKQQPGLQGLRKIQFKILPTSQAPILKPARRATLSTYSADVLKSAANDIEDTELSEALRRLSQQKSTDSK